MRGRNASGVWVVVMLALRSRSGPGHVGGVAVGAGGSRGGEGVVGQGGGGGQEAASNISQALGRGDVEQAPHGGGRAVAGGRCRRSARAGLYHLRQGAWCCYGITPHHKSHIRNHRRGGASGGAGPGGVPAAGAPTAE